MKNLKTYLFIKSVLVITFGIGAVGLVTNAVVKSAETQSQPKGWLGAGIANITSEQAEAYGLKKPVGARILDTTENSPAASAGLHEGDLILEYGGQPIEKVADLIRLVGMSDPGSVVPLKILRGKKPITLSVKIGSQEIVGKKAREIEPLPPSKSTNDSKDSTHLVVMIEGELDGVPTVGAGVIFSRDATQLYIVTANHVVRRGDRQAQRLRVLLKGLPDRWLNAHLTRHADPSPPGLDLAVLVVQGLKQKSLPLCDLPFDRLGLPTTLNRGAAVYPVGYPQGKIRWGMPVTPERVVQVAGQEIHFESFAIIGGYSGGALISKRGEVFGLIRSHDPPFAIATRIDTVLDVLRRWNYPVELRLFNTPSPLFSAVVKGDLNEVERFLEAPCVDVDERFEGWTALHRAVDKGEAATVRALLGAGAQTGARIDNPEYKDFTELQLASVTGNAEVVRLLLEVGVGAEEAGLHFKKTPLELAVWSGHRDVVRVLADAGAKTDFVRRLETGMPRVQPLHRAARNGQLEVARLLSDLGANVNGLSSDGETPLFEAVEEGHLEMVKFLLASGAKSNVKSKDHRTPLGIIIVESWSNEVNERRGRSSEESLKIAKVLIDAEARLNHVKGQGETRKTALSLATYHGQVEFVKVLLKRGTNVNDRDGLGRTVLFEAAEMRGSATSKQEQLEVLELFLTAGADVNAQDNKGDPPLCRALWGEPVNPRIKIVEILLKAGARPVIMEQCNFQSGRAWAPDEAINQLLRSYGAR